MAHRSYNVQVRLKTDKYGHPIESVEQLIRRFKKKCEKALILEDMKRKEFYLSKSQRKNLKRKLANQRRLKEEAKMMNNKYRFVVSDKEANEVK